MQASFGKIVNNLDQSISISKVSWSFLCSFLLICQIHSEELQDLRRWKDRVKETWVLESSPRGGVVYKVRVCVHMWVCIQSVYVYMCQCVFGMYICVCARTYVHMPLKAGNQHCVCSSRNGIQVIRLGGKYPYLLSHLVCLSFVQRLDVSLKLELPGLKRLIAYVTAGILSSTETLLPSAMPGFYVSSWAPNSGLHAWVANMFTD